MSIARDPLCLGLAGLLLLCGCGGDSAPPASDSPRPRPAAELWSWSPVPRAAESAPDPPGAAAVDPASDDDAAPPGVAPAAAPPEPCAVFVFTDPSWCLPCRRLEPDLRRALDELQRAGWSVAFNREPPPFVHVRVYDRLTPDSPAERRRQRLHIDGIPAIVAVDDCGDIVRAWDQQGRVDAELIRALVWGRPHPAIIEGTQDDLE